MAHKLAGGLYALIDDALRPDRSIVELARDAVAGGARVLQLRLETTADRPAFEVVRAVVALAGQARVIVNDRVDLALAAGAHGVHLGADDLPIAVARRLLGPDALIGATTRSLEDIRAAQGQGADHVGLGPVFTTSTKTVAHAPLGLTTLAAIAAHSPLPIVAIAGITRETIAAVAATGVHAAAVARDLICADDVRARATELQAAFSRGAASRGMVPP